VAELPKPATWKSYLVGLAAVAAALVARFALDPYLGNQLPYVTFFVAVTVVAWYEGLGPTLFAIMAGACVSDYFFIPPRHSFAIAGIGSQVGFGAYFMVTVPIAFLAYRQKRDAEARLKAEERLARDEAERANEDQFRTLANAIPQLCWMAEVDGFIFWYNERWYEYTGTTPEQMEGWGWKSVHDPDSLPKVLERWQSSIATGNPFDQVFPLRGADGVFRPFLTRVMPVRDAEGKVIRWFGTNTDISEQKQIEAELRKSKERLDLALEVASVGEWEVDLILHTGSRSQRHAEIFGDISSAPDWSFGSFIEHVVPEHRAEVAEKVKDSLISGVWDFETQIRRADGEIRWIWARGCSLLDETGKPVRMYGTVMDITERKLAEEALRKSEGRLTSVMENVTEGLIIADDTGRVFYWNPAALAMHGYASMEECLRKATTFVDTFEVRPLDDDRILPLADRPVSRVLRGEVLRDWELRIRRLDQGWEKIIAYSGWLIRSASGEMLAFVSTSDITERKRAEDQVRELNQQLEDRVRRRTAELESANKELEAFSYSVSHDLRAPLRAINGFSQAVMEDYGSSLPAEGQEYLGTICRGAMRMGELIDDLLAFSRLSRQSLSLSPVDTRNLVSQCLEDLEPTHKGRVIEFSVGELPSCLGDRALLKQVWTNLLSNAIKFTSNRQCASVQVGAQLEPGKVVYFVKDNGAGFDMKYANKLFGVFQRLHRNDEFEGTGVGLAIVQRIVHRHGGRVWADAVLDQGATFYFTVAEEGKRIYE
jgi:PAS domain S-box-containing protein